jgi:hypothetical protein
VRSVAKLFRRIPGILANLAKIVFSLFGTTTAYAFPAWSFPKEEIGAAVEADHRLGESHVAKTALSRA